MNLIQYVRRRLSWKLFLSYLVVVVVSVVVLASATELAIPSVFERHLADLSQQGGDHDSTERELEFFNNFRDAVNEALTLATIIALLVALVISILVSRQIVIPVRQMMEVSHKIADGSYHERVHVPEGLGWDDLDELSRLAISFNQMATQLEQIEATRRELIGNVAHEMRTPLATIAGSVEGLIDGVLTAEASTFQKIHGETDRLQRLVHDLQELSRIESAVFELNPKSVYISQLLSSATERLQHQFEEKGVNLSVNVPDNLPPVYLDEDRIGQVLLNLFGNALQYTPAGGQVQIDVDQQGTKVEVMVSDTGIGLAAEDLPLIFTRFYRVDKSRSRIGGGSGIGLTIAKNLVESHGGRIWAKSDGLGKGTIFGFSLPLT